MLNEDDYIEKINSYTKADWKPLLELIPEIEQTTNFGRMTSMKNRDGSFLMPYPDEAPVINKFRHAAMQIPVMVVFDWGSWDEGRTIVNDDNFDYDTIDIPTKCKIITALIRNERFSTGALLANFEDGLILKILKSIEQQVE